MDRRLVDISVPLQNDVAADPPGLGPKIEYIDHQQSLRRPRSSSSSRPPFAERRNGRDSARTRAAWKGLVSARSGP